ncbi:MAG: SDR family NAD(P)-dependent oxidoreductase [Vulcanimicrobiaceae bacterium]
MSSLARVHALVTGGNRGIGLVVADELARNGATVSIISRVGAGPECPYASARADVANEAEIDAAFLRLYELNGPVRILVNNAGVAESAPIHETSLGLWNRTIATNLTGAFVCSRRAVRDMLDGGGHIVNVASTAALSGYKYLSAYCASKHGVIGLTRALAAELAPLEIRVNAVCPGYVEGEMVERALQNIVSRTGMARAAARQRLADANPEGRLVAPQEVAQAVLHYCLSDATAEAMLLPGGRLA